MTDSTPCLNAKAAPDTTAQGTAAPNTAPPDTAASPESDSRPQPEPTGKYERFIPRKLFPFSTGNLFSGPLARCIFISVIIILLLTPLDMVQGIIFDRMHLYEEATQDITESWGKSQLIKGPVLIIPYRVWYDCKEMTTVKVRGKAVAKEVLTRKYAQHYKVVLPTDLNFDTTLDPEIRYRGIYRQALYTAPVSISGAFTLPEAKQFAENLHEIQWASAYLAVGISDLKTIAEAKPVIWADTELASYKPGTDAGKLLDEGFHTAVPLKEADAGARRDFSLFLNIRGSGGIYFTPVGEKTQITMQGSWPSPSFRGNLLPVKRDITDKGFSATWTISNLTRSYPQIGDLGGSEFQNDNRGSYITEFSAGVDLHEAVTLYRMVRRSLDYGILFIAVTFVALFAFELLCRRRLHLVQYAMVGLSMSLFYLILLSLAEHISFYHAFTLAGGVTVAMNGAYMASVLQSLKKGLLMGSLLAGLYAFLYSLLQMEDFALLMGTGLVVIMMGALMFATRNLPVKR